MIINSKQKEEHIKLMRKHYFLDIELSTNCNLSCVFCPRNSIERHSVFMSDELINLLPEWLPKNSSIMFSGMGEPLLHYKLMDIVDAMANNNRIIGITTNGHLLNEKMINRIIDSKLDFLQISINKIDDEEYKNVSGGVSNKELLKNVSILSSRNTKIDIQFSFIGKNDQINKSDLEEQKNFSDKHGAKFFRKELHNRGGYLADYSKKILSGCNIFSQITYINSDGNILYCCHELESKRVIGNIQQLSFDDTIIRKENIIVNNDWLSQCDICSDDGRESIII